jgi:glycosyltransferase involved in cell wall biosynthesis
MESRVSMREWSVGIVIPARNEQRRIVRCVESVVDAVKASGCKQAWIVVVADGCTDNTVPLASQALSRYGCVVACAAQSPGAARRIGVDAVLSHFKGTAHSNLWIANTDADTHVPSDWIQRQLKMANEGITALAGIVAVDSFKDHGPEGAEVFKRHYPLFEDGSHPHVHGANIGFRADVYLDAGGWRDMPVGEDHCLWRRVKQRGWPVRSSSASVVTTSGRLSGRARGGFADTLRARLVASGDVLLNGVTR